MVVHVWVYSIIEEDPAESTTFIGLETGKRVCAHFLVDIQSFTYEVNSAGVPRGSGDRWTPAAIPQAHFQVG